ncbi:hypothetical protein DL239_13465 [Sedimentitalea sp. CY04]|uniref:Uncharacterized protein n=1 Tax=Parasedimentitalea denitrificans TaxID=2211118 RepID=A0ABX0WB28_9RHOB|nr:hypothetical protein [Sedimentitalea sp. CY04]
MYWLAILNWVYRRQKQPYDNFRSSQLIAPVQQTSGAALKKTSKKIGLTTPSHYPQTLIGDESDSMME